jgi:hypothetical protein
MRKKTNRRNSLYKGKSSARKLAYQKKYDASKRQKKKRAELNKINRRAGTYGNKDGKDASHCKKGYVMEDASKNRGRRGKKKCVGRKIPKVLRRKRK